MHILRDPGRQRIGDADPTGQCDHRRQHCDGRPGSACDYLTAADIQTALGETVSATKPGTGATAGDGSQISQCVLTTSGPALLGGAADSITAFIASLVGGQTNFDLSSGGVAVIVTNTATPVTASATGAPLPSGAAAAPGVGKSAYAFPSPTGGGLAVSQVSDTKTVIIVDLESKQVTADQLSTLLKAAVAKA